MLVEHKNDVDQGGAVGPCLLGICAKKFEFYARCGGDRRLVGCSGRAPEGEGVPMSSASEEVGRLGST